MTRAVVYFDGLCGLCDRFVMFVLPRDRNHRFKFAPLQGLTAQDRLRGRLSEEGLKTIVLEDAGTLRVRSDAVLAILSRLGGAWKLAGALRIVPRPIRDAAYDLIARRRYRWFGRREACRLPLPDERDRFLP